MKKVFLLVALVAGFLSSCGDDEFTREPDSVGQKYYPLEVGNFYVFNVTEKQYANNTLRQTTTYQTREEVKGITKDQVGREWFQVQLSKRNSSSESWVVSGVRLVSISGSDLQIQENSKTTVQMVFPVKEGYGFVSNGFSNKEEPVYYTYADVAKAYTSSGKTYDNTLRITQQAETNALELKQKFEILAEGIGPVTRSNISRDYCDGSSGVNCQIGNEYIVNGFDKIEVLESFGKN